MLNPNLSFSDMIDLIPGARAQRVARYQKVLGDTPAPGCGLGCHTYLPKVARLGVLAGHTPDGIHSDIKAAIPPGKRRVSDREITDAIHFVLQTTACGGGGSTARPSTEIDRRKRLSKAETAKVRKRVLSYSNGPVELDSDAFRETHGFQIEPQPIMALHPEGFTMLQMLGELFELDDPLYIGPEYIQDSGKDNIRPAGEWIEIFGELQNAILERIGNDGWNSSTPSAFLMDLGLRYSHIVPNSVTGCLGKKKDGGLSLRCDGSIRSFNFAVVDFDDFSLDKQGEILHCLCEAMGIRICALIHTGGRGCHAWVKVDGVETLKDWNKIVRDGLFPTFEALGADPACFNPSRGSRLPGVYRCETGRWQKLLFVNREGVRI